MRLKDKVAVITGAAQGIGFACAERFGAEGAKLMLADINAGKGREAAEALAARGIEARFQAADVGLRADVEALFAATLAAYGRVDIQLSNAGITSANEFLDVREEDFDRVLRTNLKSAFLCGQAAGRIMAKRGAGAIINMASVNGVLAISNQVPYVVSKGALNQLTKVMAVSLARYNIRVNAIGPGTIMTELAREAVMGDAAARRKILSRTPLGRCGEPAEVAAVAVFLASDDASYMTGQTIYPDGGRLALNYTVAVKEE